MLAIYQAPNGHKYQYEQGTQPDGYVQVEPKPKAAPKRRTTANKRRTTENK